MTQASAVDLVMDPGNPSVLYASLDQLHRLPWDDLSGGPDSGLHKSTDGGDTWTDITRNPGLPKGVIGKIGLALSAPRPSRIWALIEAEDGALFRSDDAGATWQRINDSRQFRRWPSSYMHVVADTQDPETVYIPTYDLQRSKDGGKTFTVIPMQHGDNHALWIDPKNARRMIEGRRRRRDGLARRGRVVVDADEPADRRALRSGHRQPDAVPRLRRAERQHARRHPEPHARRRDHLGRQRIGCRAVRAARRQ